MPKFGEHPVASITRQEISDFVSKQAQKAKSNGRHCRNILRQIMNFGVREGTIERNPALDIAVAMPVARARISPDSEIKAACMAGLCRTGEDRTLSTVAAYGLSSAHGCCDAATGRGDKWACVGRRSIELRRFG